MTLGGRTLAHNYDLAIIGSGPAGYVAAIHGAQLGLKTAIVEKENHFGGTCLHWACVPAKALLFNTEVLGYFQRASDYGIVLKKFAFDWNAAEARKNAVVKRLAQGVEFLLKKNKVEIHQGYGRLAGDGRITISGPKAKQTAISAKSIVLATGSEARMIKGLEPDGKTVLTNKEALGVKKPPESIVVMGAGPWGVEFATIFHRLGTRVTLLESSPRALPDEDEEVSGELAKALQKQGIGLFTGVKVQSAAKIGKSGPAVRVVFSDAAGEVHRVDAEALLVSIGRVPNTQDAGLGGTKIEPDNGFIKVDEYMRSQEPGVYAAGDVVAGSPMLAHVGQMEAIVAVRHAAGAETEPVNYRQAPRCVYCQPEVASVGLTEAQACEAGYKVRTGKFPFSANSRA
ncbi:MAG: dihydrolipoyl dehydrogenase, partial [Acidobacteriota bacterium]|nr:dihydrolipoyl dehydrogenase [Acidobacteriota bacterium]